MKKKPPKHKGRITVQEVIYDSLVGWRVHSRYWWIDSCISYHETSCFMNELVLIV